MNITFLLTTLGFVIGLILGSFIKALADRSLTKDSFFGRSKCIFCKHQLGVLDLIPIISYLLLRGRCKYCHKKIPISYLIVELVSAGLVAFLFYQSSFFLPSLSDPLALALFSGELIFKAFFIIILSIVFLTDLNKMLIPDRIIIPGTIFAFIFLLALTIYKIGYLYFYLMQNPVGKYLLPPHSTYFQEHALLHITFFAGAVLSGLILAGLFLLLIIITKGKGMGGGDVKLAAFMGIGLGFPNIIVATMLSFIIGAFFSVGLMLVGKKGFKSVVPFGPFLVIGSLIALFWGQKIINWYLHLSIG